MQSFAEINWVIDEKPTIDRLKDEIERLREEIEDLRVERARLVTKNIRDASEVYDDALEEAAQVAEDFYTETERALERTGAMSCTQIFQLEGEADAARDLLVRIRALKEKKP